MWVYIYIIDAFVDWAIQVEAVRDKHIIYLHVVDRAIQVKTMCDRNICSDI